MPLGVLSNKILKNNTISVSYRLSFKRKYRTKLNWFFFFSIGEAGSCSISIFSYQLSDCRENKDILYHCKRPQNLSGISTGIKHQLLEHTLHFKAIRKNITQLIQSLADQWEEMTAVKHYLWVSVKHLILQDHLPAYLWAVVHNNVHVRPCAKLPLPVGDGGQRRDDEEGPANPHAEDLVEKGDGLNCLSQTHLIC